MEAIKVYLDSCVWIPREQMKPEWIEGLAERVSIPNEEKERSVKEHVWGAKDMPDEISLLEEDEDAIIMPRGYIFELLDLIKKSGKEFEIIDNRAISHSLFLGAIPKPEHLRDDQKTAVKNILENTQGIINANPGRGKTVIALAAIRLAAQNSLIIVDKLNIARQWQERTMEHLGINAGIIGDNEWNEHAITIASIKTLWSRRDEIDPFWWDKWGMLIVDECHHVPATTFYEIISKFPAYFRIGLSATVGKTPAKARTALLTLGPVIHKDDGLDVKPSVQVVKTDFDFEYRSTHRRGKRIIRNNYSKLINSIVKDQARNELIAKLVFSNSEHANLILSRRLNHLETLRDLVIDLGFPSERCWMLTGKESSTRRMEIYKLADSGNCAIFSTIADEALDIPRLDRGYLTFPQKNPETIKQQIGRLTRDHKDKKDAIIYDLVDKVEVIQNQFKTRLRELYQPMKLEILRDK